MTKTKNSKSNTTELFLIVDSSKLQQNPDGTFSRRPHSTDSHGDTLTGRYHSTLGTARGTIAKYPSLSIYRITVHTPKKATFTVTENSDSTEGRGSTVEVAKFSNFTAALEVSRNRGVMGCSDGAVVMNLNKPEGGIFDSAEEFRKAPKSSYASRNEHKVKLYDGYFGMDINYFVIEEKLT